MQRANDTDKGGVMMIDPSVIMMTLGVMNTVKTVMVVNVSTVLFCVRVGLAGWC